MSTSVVLSAVVQLLAMLAVAGGYFAASRRYRILRHPLSIIAFVTIVGVAVAAAGAVHRFGWGALPDTVPRSAVGSFGWGIVIAAAAWSVLRLVERRSR